MNSLQAGFARVNVTPMLGIHVAGYYKERIAEGILDELEINALALRCAGTTLIILSMDVCETGTDVCLRFRKHVEEATGIPASNVFIHSTHTHTGPVMEPYGDEEPLLAEYLQFVDHRMTEAAVMALQDLKPARLGFGIGRAPGIAFVRRYVMKDGSVRTNPGVNNPDVVRPVGEPDERVNVLRFDQEGGKSLVLVNFGDHPDTVGGSKISADWPGFLRKRVEKALDNTRCIFLNGAQGDVNHVNVFPKGGDLNDMFMDFDDVSRGYGHARHMGNVVAGAVLQVYDKVEWTDVSELHALSRTFMVPSNMPDPSELPLAHQYNDLHNAGKDDEIPFRGMMLTTVVAGAARMVALEHGPASFSMTLSGLTVGPIAFVGIPGEPFTGIGRGLKAAEGWTLVLPVCLTNGSEGYFPMMDCYEEGGYETSGSRFKAGVAEIITDEGLELLRDMKRILLPRSSREVEG